MIKKHILVVDDEPMLRDLYQALLENYGYTSETAKNGGEVVIKLGQVDYDAVLLDYMIPGVTDLTVLQHIQQQYPFLPVVMITGHEKIVAQALKAGAQACLYKPFDCKEFEQVLSRTVGTTPLKAELSEHVASW